MTEGWAPRSRKPDWRAYLTAEERAAVVRAEIAASEAKAKLAAATATINPIRMRACQRRLHAERRSTDQGRVG